MDDRRVGRLIRRARVRRGWRQRDLEAASGVDQTTISLIERGQYARMTLRIIRDVATAVGIPLELWPRLRAAEISRLLDEGHAAIALRAETFRRDGTLARATRLSVVRTQNPR